MEKSIKSDLIIKLKKLEPILKESLQKIVNDYQKTFDAKDRVRLSVRGSIHETEGNANDTYDILDYKIVQIGPRIRERIIGRKILDIWVSEWFSKATINEKSLEKIAIPYLNDFKQNLNVRFEIQRQGYFMEKNKSKNNKLKG